VYGLFENKDSCLVDNQTVFNRQDDQRTISLRN